MVAEKAGQLTADDAPAGARFHLPSTALLLIGFQNDFFAIDGALRPKIEDGAALDRALAGTVRLLRRLVDTEAKVVASRIAFSDGYTELTDPVGILAAIRDLKAFKSGSAGSATVPEVAQFGDRISDVTARHGFDAFFGTDLADVLTKAGAQTVLVAGALAAVCIDSTARAAREHGFRVGVVEDCTVGRTPFEHRFYCEEIFPLYGDVVRSWEICRPLGEATAEAS